MRVSCWLCFKEGKETAANRIYKEGDRGWTKFIGEWICPDHVKSVAEVLLK